MVKPVPNDNAITVVHRFGGRRCPPPAIPPSVKTWGEWDCDPTKTGTPRLKHAYGAEFPWTFDLEEKAYILEGSATMTADDAEKHGDPVEIAAGDMVSRLPTTLYLNILKMCLFHKLFP
jgi:hypothetical protein